MLSRAGKLAALLAVVSGCFGTLTGRFSELPKGEKALFYRCENRITIEACQERSDACRWLAMRDYGDVEGGHRGRQRWLLENGCPPSMVDPDAYLAGDETPPPKRQGQAPDVQEDQPMPRRKPAEAQQARDDE